ncbi:MAG: hypothetical protein GY722_18310 [bacterium]|nr:hypothetical protein [bacterium]
MPPRGNLPGGLHHPHRLTGVLRVLPPGRESTRLNVRVWSEGLTTPRIRELLLLGVPSARTPFADRVRAGQERGELDPRLDPEEVADVFVALYLGLSLQTALGFDVDAKGFSAVVSSFLTGTFATGKKGE